MLIEQWILGLRADSLNTFFRYFPLLVSDYFYITVIALGYWMKPTSTQFRSLGLLVSYSTLLNCLLKNIFQIPRPDITTHLVSVHDPFGFPSGDVQVATVFWGYLLFANRNLWLQSLSTILIMGVGLSRVYLGVHSIYDVMGGLFTGLLLLLIWHRFLKKQILTGENVQYWLLLTLTLFLYILFSRGLSTPPMVGMSVGALVGFGIALPHLKSNAHYSMSFLHALLSLGFVIIFAYFFPINKDGDLLKNLSISLKFTLITFFIFYLLPKVHHKINNH